MNTGDPPILYREMATSEPCYSWNCFINHQTGDRQRYLTGMYSQFTGALSRQTFSGCEMRNGVFTALFAYALPIYLARLAVIDDVVNPEALHLLRLVPLAWVSRTQETSFENMPTEFGPVTVRFKLVEQGRTLNVKFEPAFRQEPEKVVLHVPPVWGISGVIVNGHRMEAKPGDILKLRKTAKIYLPSR
jgi:hypothetical protein